MLGRRSALIVLSEMSSTVQLVMLDVAATSTTARLIQHATIPDVNERIIKGRLIRCFRLTAPSPSKLPSENHQRSSFIMPTDAQSNPPAKVAQQTQQTQQTQQKTMSTAQETPTTTQQRRRSVGVC
jgi:hypothetical protein